jgi:hypothetical protein
MKALLKTLLFIMPFIIGVESCKKSTTSKSSSSSAIVGFWTYKEDANNDYWNDNVLFKSDGTFRMYVALSLADTSAGPAIADTANQVVTFGTYTVSGTTVKMIWQEFSTIGFSFSGVLNSSSNNLIGNIESNVPNSASPLWYLTKP